MNSNHKSKNFLKKFTACMCAATLALALLPTSALAKVANASQGGSTASSGQTIDGTLVPLDEAMEKAKNGELYTLLDRSNIKNNVDDTDKNSFNTKKLYGKKNAHTINRH